MGLLLYSLRSQKPVLRNLEFRAGKQITIRESKCETSQRRCRFTLNKQQTFWILLLEVNGLWSAGQMLCQRQSGSSCNPPTNPNEDKLDAVCGENKNKHSKCDLTGNWFAAVWDEEWISGGFFLFLGTLCFCSKDPQQRKQRKTFLALEESRLHWMSLFFKGLDTTFQALWQVDVVVVWLQYSHYCCVRKWRLFVIFCLLSSKDSRNVTNWPSGGCRGKSWKIKSFFT